MVNNLTICLILQLVRNILHFTTNQIVYHILKDDIEVLDKQPIFVVLMAFDIFCHIEEGATVFLHGDVPYFIYTLYASGGTYAYMPTFYRTSYAYFIITFICKNSIDEGTRVKFFGVCDSVYILPEYV